MKLIALIDFICLVTFQCGIVIFYLSAAMLRSYQPTPIYFITTATYIWGNTSESSDLYIKHKYVGNYTL